MNWLSRLFRKKDAGEVTGGLELLKRLTGQDFQGKRDFLAQYSKSLYVFACISKIAGKTASIPLQLYRIQNSRGEMKEVQTHPALDLLYKPNPFQTRTEFVEKTIINLKCSGDAFWYKARNSSGRPVELWNLRPDRITVVTDPAAFILKYQFSRDDGTIADIMPADVVHFSYPDALSDVLGLSPLKPAQIRIQTEEHATTYQRDFFINSARPDAVLYSDNAGTLDEDEKNEIRRQWYRRHGGVNNSSKVAILGGGLKYQQISVTQKDMDYIEGTKLTRDDILTALGVPKPIVAVTDDVNRANAETAMAIFLSETIKPEISRIVEKINEELIYPDFGEDLYVNFPDPTPKNRELMLQEYQNGLQNNWLLINEVRQREGLEPIKGGWTFYMPIANIPAGGLPQKSIITPAKSEADIYEHPKSEKLYEFRGRYWLKQKLELRESMEKTMRDALKQKGKAKKTTGRRTKRTWAPLVKAEIRETYAGLVVKKMDAQTTTLTDALNKFFAEQGERVKAALLKKKAAKGAKKVTVTVEQIFKKDKENELTINFITPWLDQYMKDAGKEALRMVTPQKEWQDSAKIQKAVEKRAKDLAESVNNTTLESLTRTLAEGIDQGEGIDTLADRVTQVYADFAGYRSERIARTEATAANNSGALEGYRQSDVANGKEWIATMDQRTRDSHAQTDGEIVGLEEKFSNGLTYPGELGAPPEETINCRCVLAPAFSE